MGGSRHVAPCGLVVGQCTPAACCAATLQWRDARIKDLHAKSAWADTLAGPWSPEPAKIDSPLGGPPEQLQPSEALCSPVTTAPPHLSLGRWLIEGLRAAFFLRPRTGASAPTPWQLMVLVIVGTALLLGMARLEVAGPAQFNARGWLVSLWSGLLTLWLAWWAMAPAQARCAEDGRAPSGGLAAWYALSSLAPLPPTLLTHGLLAVVSHKPLLWASDMAGMAFWAIYGGLTAWIMTALVVIGARFIRSRGRTAVYAAGLMGVIALGAWQFPDRPWEPYAEASLGQAAASRGFDEDTPEPVRLAAAHWTGPASATG